LRLVLSQEQITQKIVEVCQKLDQDYLGKQPVILMIMKGSICLVADLIRHLHVPNTIEFIQTKSYGERGVERGDLAILGIENLNLSNKDVLVVDDIFDSGKTLQGVLKKIQELRPKSLKSLVLLSKRVSRSISLHPEYVLFEIENQFVVGYGLDYKEHFRGLSGVYALNLEHLPPNL
jgi:hypoxanthine phosphoribosyltransferase